MPSPDARTLAALRTIITSDRLGPYEDACRGDSVAALRLYCWNIEASAAILGASAISEVAIRNSMHLQLSTHAGRPDWWETARLDAPLRMQVTEAAAHLDRRRGGGAWSPGHLVAEMKASFWEALLANRYHRSLWEPALRAAFPHYSGRRGDLRARMERVRLLRNRAAHHEPVHARDLWVDHRYMCELAAFISPHLSRWMGTHSRLPSVIEARARTVSGERRTRF